MFTWSCLPRRSTAWCDWDVRRRSQYSRMGTARTLITVPSASRRCSNTWNFCWIKRSLSQDTIITSHSRETQFRNCVSSVDKISSFPERKTTFSTGYHQNYSPTFKVSLNISEDDISELDSCYLQLTNTPKSSSSLSPKLFTLKTLFVKFFYDWPATSLV